MALQRMAYRAGDGSDISCMCAVWWYSESQTDLKTNTLYVIHRG